MKTAKPSAATKTDEVTPKMRKTLAWVANNPGKFPAQMPTSIFRSLRDCERSGLIIYSETLGWKITPKGEKIPE